MHGPGALALLINIRGCRDKVFGECSLACASVPLHVPFLSFFACVAHRETSQVNMSGFYRRERSVLLEQELARINFATNRGQHQARS